jgi:uncharacterized protein
MSFIDKFAFNAKIFENLVLASRTNLDFNISIRMHLHAENLDDVENTLATELIKTFAHDPRFALHPISIGNYGGAFNHNDIKTTTRKMADESRVRILARFNKAQQSDDSVANGKTAVLPNAQEGAGDVCYAAAANSFAIRSDGNIVKCTTALNDPKNQIGRIQETGELDIDPALIKLWMGGFFSGSKGELACSLHKVASLPYPSGAKIIPIALAAA